MSAKQIIGSVKFIHPNGKNKGVLFTLTSEGKDYKCLYNGFCPLQEKDSCLLSIKEGNPSIVLEAPLVSIPTDRDSIIAFLVRSLRSSRLGELKAAKMYEHMVKESKNGDVVKYLNKLAQDFEFFHDESKIQPYTTFVGKEAMRLFLSKWNKTYSIRPLWLLGLNNKEIKACKMSYDKIYEYALNNPYVLAAIPMDKCIAILNKRNKKPTDEQLYCGNVLRFVYKHQDSWAVTPLWLIKKEFPDYTKYVKVLVEQYNLVVTDEYITTTYVEKCENQVAQYVAQCVEADKVEKKLYTPSYTGKRKLSQDQEQALTGALNKSLSIISGKAGAGKTTIINELVFNLDKQGLNYALLSFPGKAAGRISQVTGKKASTIHRFINNISGKKTLSTSKDDNNPAYSYIIIDEASMVTTSLFYTLLEILQRYQTKAFNIILVGDINQLPPIGWGTLMSQLIKSGQVPVYYLTHNHRCYQVNGEVDGVMLNSDAIVEYKGKGQLKIAATTNFQFVSSGQSVIYDSLMKAKKNGVTSDNITIISPYNKDLAYVNKIAQQIFVDGNDSIKDRKGQEWFVGDRVICLENLNDIEVYNGSEGKVTSVGQTSILVKFGDKEHEFDLPTSDDIKDDIKREEDEDDDEYNYHVKGLKTSLLMHSYALTVHRSQGSEWNFVMLILPEKDSNFIDKQLIYTAITRAKRAVYIVGNTNVFTNGAMREARTRYDDLSNKIKLALTTKEETQIAPVKELEVKEKVNDIALKEQGKQAAEKQDLDEEPPYEFDPI